jgi:hypothetical protein
VKEEGGGRCQEEEGRESMNYSQAYIVHGLSNLTALVTPSLTFTPSLNKTERDDYGRHILPDGRVSLRSYYFGRRDLSLPFLWAGIVKMDPSVIAFLLLLRRT